MITEKILASSVSSSAAGVFFSMAEATQVAIVAQVGALLLAGLAAFVSWRTHKAVNSRMDEFKVMFSKSKIDEGVLQEKQAQQDRRDAKSTGIVEEQQRQATVNTPLPPPPIPPIVSQ
jgi:hypothetical protein